MKKLLCKRNLVIAIVFICLVSCAILSQLFGKTEVSESNRKANVLIYCLVAIILSIVMFSSIMKIIDRKTKKYFIVLFCLFAFWLGIKIFDKTSIFNDYNDYTWYLLYIPLLFIPTMWLIINNQIYIKNAKFKNIIMLLSLSIAAALFVLVLTNDFHQLVFIFPDGTIGAHASDYKYNVGYFVIYAFVFIEILTTIVLFYTFSVNKATIKQKTLPSIVILLVLIYSIMYVVTDINVPYLSDMTLVYTILGTILVYTSLKCGLIKNSGAYFEFFQTCAIPLAIINENSNVEYENEEFKKVKGNEDYLLQKQQLLNGTLLILQDVENIKRLQNQLTRENEKIEYSNKLLQKKKEILQNEKQLEQRTILLEKIEEQIKNKKMVLEKLLNELPIEINKNNRKETKDALNEIKIVIGYLKRKTSLLLLAEQKKEITKDEVKLLFNESFNDLKQFGINAGIGIDVKPIPVDTLNKFYDIYNELITCLKTKCVDIWLTIKKRKVWELEVTIDGITIENLELKMPLKYGVNYEVRYDDGDTLICFKEKQE